MAAKKPERKKAVDKKKRGKINKERTETEYPGSPVEEDRIDGGAGDVIALLEKETLSASKSKTAFKIIRIIFLWIPLAVISLVAAVLITAGLILTPARVESLVVDNFNSRSYGTISLKVDSFNLYSGFSIRNLVIRNGKEFNNSKFVEIEKLALKYGFFSIFIGNIHFDEIGIYKPRIYLEEKNGAWNFARLMHPTQKTKEEEKPEEGPPSKEINLPISVQFLLKFVLDDLRLYAKGSAFKTSVEGLTYNMDIWMPPFKRIPKSLEAATLLERMKIELNPREEMDVSFYSRDAEAELPLVLTWKLIFNKGADKKANFTSFFKFGTYKTPVRFKRTHLAPLNFMISYDMLYNPASDFLELNHFGVRFLGRKWLFLTGSVKNVTTSRNMDIRMTESNIVLDDFYPYFLSITGDTGTRFKGAISLFPLSVQGTPSSMDIKGEINCRNIFFKNPSAEAALPLVRLSYSVLKRSENMRINAKLDIPHLAYALERDRSGDNGLELNADVSALNGFQRVNLNGISLRLFNPEKKANALDIALKGDVELKPAMSGRISVTRFTFRKEPLPGMLTAAHRKSLEAVNLQKPVDIILNLGFSMAGGITAAALDMMVKVPDYNVNDLNLALDVAQNENKKLVALHRLHIGSKLKNLSIDARGNVEMKTQPVSDSDLKLAVSLNAPELNAVYGPWQLAGLFKLNASVKGDLKKGKAFGNIRIEKLFVKNDQGALRSINDLNLNFPFEYYFTPRYSGESRITVDKSSVIENENFREKENFTIKSVWIKHPSREDSLECLKDFSATMFFRNNTFEIVQLKAYVLDGSFYGRNILFNLADMKKENMEFKMVLDITNVDIGKLDNVDPKKKKRDAEISLNANFTGHNVDMSKEINMKGFINISKVGEKFANRLLKGLSEQKGESKLGGIGQFVVDNFQKVKGFNFTLDKGLVYTTVSLDRRLLGFLATFQDEKISFERMPIQEYLRKVREAE